MRWQVLFCVVASAYAYNSTNISATTPYNYTNVTMVATTTPLPDTALECGPGYHRAEISCESIKQKIPELANLTCSSVFLIVIQHYCVECPQGTYQPGYTKQSSCMQCPDGKYSFSYKKWQAYRGELCLTGADECVECGRGTYLHYNMSYTCRCTSCPFGYMQPDRGKTSCTLCFPGTYYTYNSCLYCSPGTYSTAVGSFCPQCPASKYATGWGNPACYDCFPGYYQTFTGECYPCSAGKYSTGSQGASDRCDECPTGTYSSGSGFTQCTQCGTLTYSLDGASVCTSCAPHTYSPWCAYSCPPDGQYFDMPTYSCKPCEAGTYTTRSTDACALCDYGTYKSTSGSGTCLQCEPGTYALEGYTQCNITLTVHGTTSTPAPTTSPVPTTTAPLTSCNQGSYLMSGQCIECPTGKYQPDNNSPLTSCLQCPNGTYSFNYNKWMSIYMLSDANKCLTAGTTCKDCPAGTYMDYRSSYICECSACPVGSIQLNTGQSSCALCAPGTFTLPNTDYCFKCWPGSYSNRSSDDCMACTAGTYFTGYGMTACHNTYVSTTTALSTSTTTSAQPVTTPAPAGAAVQCGLGYTVYRLKNGDPILSGSSIQCIPCASCVRGSIVRFMCTNISQTTCVQCPWYYEYKTFEVNGECVQDITPGYHPYTVTIPQSYQAMLLTNAEKILLPTTKISYEDAVVNQLPNTDLELNILVPCANVLPEGYAWATYSHPETVVRKILTVSNDEIAGQLKTLVENCDLGVSTTCMTYETHIKQGWHWNGITCVSCTDSSIINVCSWQQYGDINTCGYPTDSQCRSCRGQLPLYAEWTKAKPPYYFDDSEPMPCEWDCFTGFYKDNDQCLPCTNKPAANAVYVPGPFRFAGETGLDTCLTPNNCWYFGGTKERGCMWNCHYDHYIAFSDMGTIECVKCRSVTCLPGTTLDTDARGCPS